MTTRIWHKGPPPHVGWWNTRVIQFENADRWGWWDGKWSEFAISGDSPERAALQAAKIGADSGSADHVEWSDYWPENARVPRGGPTERRPGLWTIVLKIHAEHPAWTPGDVVAEAKLQWHRQQR